MDSPFIGITFYHNTFSNMKPNAILIFYLSVSSLLLSLSYSCQPSENGSVDHTTSQKKKSKYEASLERLRQEVEMTKDRALGYVPRERLLAARKYADQRRKELASRFTPNGTPIPGVTWDERGPDNVGGRTRALMFDPNDINNQTVYAGSVAGGLWRSDNITIDGGWTKIDDFWDNLAVTCLDYDPSNTMIFYAGTGEGFGNVDAVQGEGIWKSSDGGATWGQIGSTANSNFYYNRDLIVADNGNLLAATHSGLHLSSDGGATWSFQKLGGVIISDLERAANGDLFAGGEGDIWKSTDNGVNWSNVLTTGSNRVEISCAPSNSQHLYAVAYNGGISWIKKSEDGGTSWTDKTIPKYTEQSCSLGTNDFDRGQGWYNLILQVKENDPNAVIIGGIDLNRSTNSGSTWGLISYWTGGCDVYVHADQHNLIRRPGSNVEMISSNDGGVFYSPDAWAADPDWQSRNSGYNVTQGYACANHPDVGSDYFLQGNQDNGTQQFTAPGINSTTEVTGGDGGFPHIDQNDGNIQITAYTNNNYSISTNGGTSFSGLPSQGGGRFINPTDYDDGDQMLYAAKDVGNYLRWNDPATGGSSFSTVTVSNFPGLVSAVTQSPNVTSRVYFGFPDGSVYYVDNANTGTSKTATLLKARLGSGYISSIDIEDGNENHVIVTSSSFGSDQIVETTNGGTSWTILDNNLPDMPVRWGIFAPGNSDQILLATELGVWSTDNINGTATMWDPTNGGLANVRTDMLQVRKSDNLVSAATHGRGLYTTGTFQQLKANFGDGGTGTGTETVGVMTDGTCMVDYTEVQIPITLSGNPSSLVTVNLVINGASTASENLDFVLVDASLSFTNGGPLTQFARLRILDDAITEVSESVIIDLTVPANGANAVAGTVSQYTYTIGDDDTDPTMVTVGKIILQEDFNGGIPGTWTLVDISGGGNWVYDDSSPSNSGNHSSGGPINSNSGDGWITFPSDGYGNDGLAEEAEAIMPVIDCSQYNNVTLEFNQFFRSLSEQTRIKVSNDNINFTTFMVGNNDSQTSNTNSPNPELNTINISSVADGHSTVYIKFYWKGNYDWWWQVDDVKVKGDFRAPIATTTVQTQTSNLGAGETGHFYDAGGDIIASVANTGADVGCITVSVETQGTGQSAAGFASGKFYTDKTIHINADNNQTYDITLYYTQNEMNVWSSPPALNIVKSSVPLASATATDVIIDAMTVSNQYETGAKWSFTGSFSGFSSFALTDAETALPLKLISFSGKKIDHQNQLDWRTAQEVNVSHFEIERSADAHTFETIGRVPAGKNSYTFLDNIGPIKSYYYRLKMIDIDGQFDYSPIVYLPESILSKITIYPNPFQDQLWIDGAQPSDTEIKVFDADGVLRLRQPYTPTSGLQLDQLPAGLYIIEVHTAGHIMHHQRIVKVE